MKTKRTKVHVKRVNLSNEIAFATPSTKGAFTKLVKACELTVTQTQEIKQIYDEADSRGLDEPKTEHLLEHLGIHLKDSKDQLPDDLLKKHAVIEKQQADMSLMDKLKTSIPIIAFMVRAEVEEYVKEPFMEIWLDLKNGFTFKEEATDRGWGDISANRKPVRVVAGVTIYKTPEDNYQFTCGATICVDGAPTAYAPNDGGQDLTSSAGHNKGDVRTYQRDKNRRYILDANGKKIPATFWDFRDWFGVETDTGESDGEPVLKPDGYYISVSSYNYTGFPRGVRTQARYVNADVVSFAVMSIVSANALGLKIGDLIYVKNIYKGKNKGKWAGFLETRRADDKIGEISTSLADAIGVPSNPRNGGQDGDIEYTFYPNTAPNYHFKNDKEAAYYIFWNGKNIEEGKPVNRDLRLPS